MTDFLLVAWVSALIEIRRVGWMFGLGHRWESGEKLRLLFAGYTSIPVAILLGLIKPEQQL